MDGFADSGTFLLGRLTCDNFAGFLGADGYPVQRRGVTSVKGLFVLGLDWLHNAKSGLFAGIGDDATYLASVIASRPAGRRKSEGAF
jgi:hypothetical protein